MKFRSKYARAIYIVRPTVRGVDNLGILQIKPGLRAVFDRYTHEFDSRIAQENHNWSDEEREAVEMFLLKHKDYGNGLIAMPGQELPEAAQKLIEEKAPLAPCAFVEFKNGEVFQCGEKALPGSTFCDTHREKKTKITRGMLTTQT